MVLDLNESTDIFIKINFGSELAKCPLLCRISADAGILALYAYCFMSNAQ